MGAPPEDPGHIHEPMRYWPDGRHAECRCGATIIRYIHGFKSAAWHTLKCSNYKKKDSAFAVKPKGEE